MTTNLAPGLHPGIPAQRYHSGLSNPRPLSSTLAKNLLRKLPTEARWELEHDTRKPAFDLGTLWHEAILEGGFKSAVILDHDSFRTKAAQQERDDAEAAGLIPILADTAAEIIEPAEEIRNRPDVAELLAEGDTEVSALAVIDGVPVQARYDYLRLPKDGESGYIVDMKTVAGSANPRDFNRSAATYGYHIQAAIYQLVTEALGYGALPFVWLVISKDKPNAHSVIQASGTDLAIGEALARLAIEKWRDITTNGWPTVTPLIQSQLPTWAAYEAEEIK